jgi:hypothetical protein
MRIPSHGGGMLRPFQPGNAANPGGLGGQYREVLALARQASPYAMKKLIKLIDHRNPRVAAVAAEKVLERAWGKVKEVDPSAAIDPEAAERRSRMRAEVIRMLQALAVPEALIEGEADQGQNLPSRQGSRQVAAETDPHATDDW